MQLGVNHVEIASPLRQLRTANNDVAIQTVQSQDSPGRVKLLGCASTGTTEELGVKMRVSRDAMHRMHQTKAGAALRKLPPVAHVAQSWWSHTQSEYFRAVCSAIPAPSAPGSEGSAAPPVPVPSLDDVVAKLPELVLAGEEFSREMSQHCKTTKFLSYTAMKGSVGYQDIYAQILKNHRGHNLKMLEIGIGVNDPTAKSGMGKQHRPGASLRGWCGYFPGAEVHGADVDPRCLVDSDQFKTHLVDQRDPESLENLAKKLGGGFDLIVDDGLHTPEANANVIAAFLPLLNRRGMMVIEDIQPIFDSLWFEAHKYLPESYRVHYFPSSVLRQFRGPSQVGIAVITQK